MYPCKNTQQSDLQADYRYMTAKAIASIKPADLPAPPQAALHIVKACSEPEITSQELSRLAAADPVLTAELLRVVNSPYFGMSRQVQSISHAVTVLGLRALRNYVLCLSVRDSISKEAIPNFNMSEFWEDSLRRAVVAQHIAKLKKMDAEDGFTAGMLQDFGLLTLFYLQPEQAGHWTLLRSLDPDTRLAEEHSLFASRHDHLFQIMAQHWGLPDDLVAALGQHHNAETDSMLAKVLLAADWVNSVYTNSNAANVLHTCKAILREQLQLNDEQIDQLLEATPSNVSEAAQSFGLDIDAQSDLEQVLRSANVRLAEENISYQELTWQLEQTLKQRDQLQQELNRELTLAREIQASLLPHHTDKNYPVHGVNISARELSGDFFDHFTLPDGRVYFNLGDVSGKGMNAALLMAKTSSLFRCLGKKIHSPAELLNIINNEICETSIRGMFVTMVAGLYDPKTSEVLLVNAGNPPPLHWLNKKQIKGIAADGPPLGIIANTEYPEVKLNLSGGNLYIFSDGVTEGYTEDGNELGIKGLVQLIAKHQQLEPVARLEAIVKYLQHGEILRDDITMVLVEAGNQVK